MRSAQSTGMKTKNISLFIKPLLFILLAACIATAVYATASCNISVASAEVIDPEFGVPPQVIRPVTETVVQTEFRRVLNPEEVSRVELVAFYTDKSLFARGSEIRIYSPNAKEPVLTIVPPQNAGYEPNLYFADFTGGGYEQIFYSVQSGGSGGYAFQYLFDVSNAEIKTLYDGNGLDGFKAEYADCYKVKVYNEYAQYLIDISSRPADYLDELYNADGTLKAPRAADVWGVSYAFPTFNPAQERYILTIFRRITGLYNADSFGYVVDFLEYDDGAFRSYYQGVLIN